jgi:DNA-binding IclR family transcriptional regulator
MARDPSPTMPSGYHTRVSQTSAERGPQNHRTVDRVTRIVEEVVYRPGITLADLARTLDAPKSSVHGFVRGLLAKGWLYEDGNKFFLGPAIYGLTMASGQMSAGSVSQADLDALHRATGAAVFMGVRAGDNLIYVSVAGTDAQTGFAARSNIRRELLDTAGGKAILAELSDQERDAYLRRRPPEQAELVQQFLTELRDIKANHTAENFRYNGRQFAIATVVHNQFGEVAGEITLIGPAEEFVPRKDQLRQILLTTVSALTGRRDRGRVAG